MFGYVLPQKDKLRPQDNVLYHAFYCGLCKATGALFGQLPRFAVTYDSAFMAILCSDCLDYPQKISPSSCAGNPFKKNPMIERNQFMDKIASVNVLLARYKLLDDVLDGKKKYRLALKLTNKAYNKAKALSPEADKIIADGYEKLRKKEAGKETSVDAAADCFASMLKNLFADILGEKADGNVLSLTYNVGKFVYIADALDDVDEDFASGNYNPLLCGLGKFEGRKQFITANEAELGFIFSSTVNSAIAAFNRMSFRQSYSLLENIIYYGLRAKTEQLFASEKKLDRPKI